MVLVPDKTKAGEMALLKLGAGQFMWSTLVNVAQLFLANSGQLESTQTYSLG